MALMDDATSDHIAAGTPHASLCVLASGSSANCAAIVTGDPASALRRICLVDLGLSPKRTFRLLAEHGLRADQIDDILITHLDSDHFHHGWTKPGILPPHVRVRVHAAHEDALAARWPSIFEGPELGGARVYDEPFDLAGAAHVRPHLVAHDDAGAVSFRFDFPDAAGSLGYATDLGCITSELIEHLFEVDVLAIESNYCPRMQNESARPDFLKQRIMGGRGHLSNQQALEAIRHIEPRLHVVLLHLSRQCNDPSLVASLHEGADYALTISRQHEPTRWVRIAPHPRAPLTLSPRPLTLRTVPHAAQQMLFPSAVPFPPAAAGA